MVSTTQKKRGRPQGRHRMRDGTEVQGLTRRADGRWKISATGQTFVEPDEGLAVARFRQIEAKHAPSNLGTVRIHRSAKDAMVDIARRTLDAGGYLQTTITHAAGDGANVGAYAIADHTLSEEQWAWLRRQLLTRPLWVAQRVGIEQIGYLPTLERPIPAPTMVELIECYANKPGLSKDEATRCRRFWKEFTKIAGIRTIRELRHEHAQLYEQTITRANLAPKSIKHRYSRIRTVIAYAMKRGSGQADCRKALDTLTMLEVEHVNTLDPNPISPADFWAIHGSAGEADDCTFAALMVFALNCALYPSEVAAVRWDDVDLKRGEFTTRRRKTQVPRVAILWPEALKAVRALPRERQTIFNTPSAPYTRCTLHRRWNEHRTAAGVPANTTFAQIRDAAFTIACRVSLDQARVLAGHRLPGATDHYVLRAPGFVREACVAVRREFVGRRKP